MSETLTDDEALAIWRSLTKPQREQLLVAEEMNDLHHRSFARVAFNLYDKGLITITSSGSGKRRQYYTATRRVVARVGRERGGKR